jgi:hypothetical protein
MARRERRGTARVGAIVAVVVGLLILVASLLSDGFGELGRDAGGTVPSAPGSPAPGASGTPPIEAGAATDPLAEAGLLVPVGTGLEAGESSLRVDAGAVAELLATRPVDDRGTPLRYQRDAFGQRWADVERNGCDQRNDVLARDLVQAALREGSGCVVVAGTLLDPYTGTAIPFERGQDTSAAVQIDHVVPLAWAWQHGAASWTIAERQLFANDLANLLAVDGPTNGAKSSSGPGEWLPPAAAHSCLYVTRWVFVLDRYDLAIGADDHAVVADTLERCRS